MAGRKRRAIERDLREARTQRDAAATAGDANKKAEFQGLRMFLGKVCFLYEDAQGEGECGGVFCGQKTGLDIRTPSAGDVRSHQTPPRSPSRGDVRH